jgi:hypothetical protein
MLAVQTNTRHTKVRGSRFPASIACHDVHHPSPPNTNQLQQATIKIPHSPWLTLHNHPAVGVTHFQCSNKALARLCSGEATPEVRCVQLSLRPMLGT